MDERMFHFLYYDSEEKTLRDYRGSVHGHITWKGKKFCVGGKNWRTTNCPRIFRVRAKLKDGMYAGTCAADSGTYCKLRKARRGKK